MGRDLISSKLEMGDIKGAIRIASSSNGMAPNSPQTLISLMDLHPLSKNDYQIKDAGNLESQSIQPTPAMIMKAIKSFPCGSAGGTSRRRWDAVWHDERGRERLDDQILVAQFWTGEAPGAFASAFRRTSPRERVVGIQGLCQAIRRLKGTPRP